MFMYHVTNVDIYYYCIHSNHHYDTKYIHYGTVMVHYGSESQRLFLYHTW